jgi:hypothetical protein
LFCIATFTAAELKVIFETMEKNDLHFQQLGPDQKFQIQQYVDAVLAGGSPMKPSTVASSGKLVGKWRLEYSNEEKFKVCTANQQASVHCRVIQH